MACSARPARASSRAFCDVSASAATRESVARAAGRLSICCSRPSSSAASLAGAREAAACNADSASAYSPRAMAARPRSATTLGSFRSSFSVSVSTSAYRPSMICTGRGLERRRRRGGRLRPALSLRHHQHGAQRDADRQQQRQQIEPAREGARHLASYYIRAATRDSLEVSCEASCATACKHGRMKGLHVLVRAGARCRTWPRSVPERRRTRRAMPGDVSAAPDPPARGTRGTAPTRSARPR